MFTEFKKFISKGNIAELAIAVIIGGAFGKIVSSLVADVIMPLVGLATGGVNFADKFVNLSGKSYATLAEAKAAGAATLNYGQFVQTIVDFLIVAFVIFIAMQQLNRFKKPEPVADPTTRDCPECLMSIPIKATRCGHCTSAV